MSAHCRSTIDICQPPNRDPAGLCDPGVSTQASSDILALAAESDDESLPALSDEEVDPELLKNIAREEASRLNPGEHETYFRPHVLAFSNDSATTMKLRVRE